MVLYGQRNFAERKTFLSAAPRRLLGGKCAVTPCTSPRAAFGSSVRPFPSLPPNQKCVMLVSESFFILSSSFELQMGGVWKRGLGKGLERLLGENEPDPGYRKK